MTASLLGVKTRPGGIFDAELELKDAGLLAASAACQVDSAAAYLDLGAGVCKGKVVIDVSALEIATNDETYTIFVQGSNTTAFTAAGIAELCSLNLGCSQLKVSDCDKDDAIGRYKMFFDNEQNGTYYRYVRLYVFIAGTIATGINFTAFMTKE